MVALDVGHEGMDDLAGNRIDAVVIIAVFREVALNFIINDNAAFIPDRLDLGIFDRCSESATTDRPAMPVANQRLTSLSCSAICSFS